jgi:hypothetical protein
VPVPQLPGRIQQRGQHVRVHAACTVPARALCGVGVCVVRMVATTLCALCTHTLFGFVPALASQLACPAPYVFCASLTLSSMMPDFVKLCFFGPCLPR